ncbi:hypothetical protein RJ641_027825 [Dillenia turbinata]|uniref:Uncharacterized protein n=1 Tax=Dillenia turbinata TaxID=194707 RepID=A0AAN8W9K0_9MAGN
MSTRTRTEIRSLSSEEDVSAVLDNWVQSLRKGSLSLTVRELGRMSLPGRALQTFCWAQKQPGLVPDDRSLASTIEILARSHELKIPFDLDKLTCIASRGIIEAMIGWLGKNPDKQALALTSREELGEREDLQLNQQDCTALMKGMYSKETRLHNESPPAYQEGPSVNQISKAAAATTTPPPAAAAAATETGEEHGTNGICFPFEDKIITREQNLYTTGPDGDDNKVKGKKQH